MKRCNRCNIGLSKTYTDYLCPKCRSEQDKLDEEVRIAGVTK